MKVWQKGFLLVCIPVIFNSCCVVFLLDLLRETVGYATVERRQGQLLSDLNEAYVDYILSTGQFFSYFSSRGRNQINKRSAKEYMGAYRKAMARAKISAVDNPEILQQFQKLEQGFSGTYDLLESGESESTFVLSTQYLLMLKPWIKQVSDVNTRMAELIRMQNEHREKSKLQMEKSITRLQRASYFLLGINFVCMILSLIILRSSIVNRLQLILRKAAKLPGLEDLGNPLSGNDELVELDKALHQAFLELKEAQQFRADITSMVAHDLRSPLTSMGFSLEMISGQTGLSEKSQKQLEMGRGTLKRLLALIDDFLDTRKMDAGKLELNIGVIDSETIVKNSIQMVSDLARMKNITIHTSCQSKTFKGDEERLSQVLVNLLSNSIKFSHVNGNVRVDIIQKEQRVEISIADDGPGISNDVRDSIFDRFKQDTSKGKVPGSGLGLFIAKWIVESHGGEISVESSEGAGTVFIVSLDQENFGE